MRKVLVKALLLTALLKPIDILECIEAPIHDIILSNTTFAEYI